ncbi:MAG: acyl-CoA dehydrogenase family protein [Actinomycetota bacterium]|nr:acyl-CoA dehydrogenase family protein [Actinomycetota bacterium]
MDFDLTDEQRMLRETVIDFAKRELDDDVMRHDREGRFSREAWRKCAKLGLQGLPVPTEYGGSGADPVTVVVALEALGYACRDNGLIFSLNAQMWSCETPIVKFGSETQKRRYLPALCDGSIIAGHGMSEPESGSDAFSLSTTAEKRGAAYVLTGSKTFVTNGPESDVFVVFATTDRSKGFAGLCAFLVDRDTPGLTVGSPLSKMGLRTSPMSEIFLDGCTVPEEQLLGKPGAGMAMFNASMLWERSLILASTLGTMRRQLERCIEYARERKQFGQPIGRFQAVSHRIVDMKLRLETARLLLYRLGWLLARGESAALESALTKLYLSECFVQSSLDALQIHGGYGYMTEYALERDVRDAIASRIYSGTSDIQHNIAAGYLGL